MQFEGSVATIPDPAGTDGLSQLTLIALPGWPILLKVNGRVIEPPGETVLFMVVELVSFQMALSTGADALPLTT